MGYWCSLVTQDVTASARIAVEAETADMAREAILSFARTPQGQAMFELDEGSEPVPYFGDPEDLEQLGEVEYRALMSIGLGGHPSALQQSYEERHAQELIDTVASSVADARRMLGAGNASGAIQRLQHGLCEVPR